MSRWPAAGIVLLGFACGLTPEMLGPRPDAELCFGKTSADCEYAWDPVDERVACPDANGRAVLHYVLINAGEEDLEYELSNDPRTDPGFLLLGKTRGTIDPFGEQPFSLICDPDCMDAFRASEFDDTSYLVSSNDPRRPKFNFKVLLYGYCR